jgi:quercetin dioxygenase-like cupin family protein
MTIATTLAGVLVALTAGIALGQSEEPSAPAPQIEPVGAFTVGDIVGYPSGHAFSISVPSGTTVQTAMLTLPPGFDFGWHSHTGGVVVTVTSGALTLYDTTCVRQEVAAGGGFLEEVGTVHRARNEGSEPVALVVTFLGVPADQATDVEADAPCDVGA